MMTIREGAHAAGKTRVQAMHDKSSLYTYTYTYMYMYMYMQG